MINHHSTPPSISLADLVHLADGAALTVSGCIREVHLRRTHHQHPWATATLTDPTGEVEIRVFPVLYPDVAALIVPGAHIDVTGRLSSPTPDVQPAVFTQLITATPAHPNDRRAA